MAIAETSRLVLRQFRLSDGEAIDGVFGDAEVMRYGDGVRPPRNVGPYGSSGRRERAAMKIVVIGGSGLIGKKVVMKLRERGHEVVAVSPSLGVNTVTGEGLAQALAGAAVVVDVANAPSW